MKQTTKDEYKWQSEFDGGSIKDNHVSGAKQIKLKKCLCLDPYNVTP